MTKRFIGARQTTLRDEVVLSGIGVHSGAPVSLILHPAEADTGICFIITRGDEIVSEMSAKFDAVTDTMLCTVLTGKCGSSVATVEHLLAALRGMSVDNAYIEIDSGEVPIMDGSAAPFVDAIDEVGLRELSAPRKFIKVLKPVRVEEGDCWGELRPHSGFHLDVEIQYETSLIGRQRMTVEMNPGVFRAELARARTFGFMSDVEKLWANGRALGASLENTVALGDDRVVNPEGLRFSNEFVRHKTLDAVGDLSLAGAPLLCAFRSVRGGHRLNSRLVHALMKDETAWCTVTAPTTSRDAAQGGLSVGTATAEVATADRI